MRRFPYLSSDAVPPSSRLPCGEPFTPATIRGYIRRVLQCLCLGKKTEARPLLQRHCAEPERRRNQSEQGDRKSTRLNSSHQIISYAVFCLKKKTKLESNNRL